MSDEVQPIYLSPLDLAKLFSVHRNTVYRLIRTGVIPSVKIGWCHKIHVQEAMRIFETGAVRDTAPRDAKRAKGDEK